MKNGAGESHHHLSKVLAHSCLCQNMPTRLLQFDKCFARLSIGPLRRPTIYCLSPRSGCRSTSGKRTSWGLVSGSAGRGPNQINSMNLLRPEQTPRARGATFEQNIYHASHWFAPPAWLAWVEREAFVLRHHRLPTVAGHFVSSSRVSAPCEPAARWPAQIPPDSFQAPNKSTLVAGSGRFCAALSWWRLARWPWEGAREPARDTDVHAPS